ncbi:hypothetical protein E2542_SST23129 [Spatholobus suberectus]|nr:hypothetical protein E2542_SST23129 [Spatholobus suberectus]
MVVSGDAMKKARPSAGVESIDEILKYKARPTLLLTGRPLLSNLVSCNTLSLDPVVASPWRIKSSCSAVNLLKLKESESAEFTLC